MAIRVAFAYLTGVDVIHFTEYNHKKMKKIFNYSNNWFYVPSTLKSRMTEVEIMAVFGRYQTRNMEFDHIKNMIKNALNKLDPRTHKFQVSMLHCINDLLKQWIVDAHMTIYLPNASTLITCLDLAKGICRKQLKDFADNDDVEFNENLADEIITTYVNGSTSTDKFDFATQLNVDGVCSKQVSTHKWVSFLAAVHVEMKKTKQNTPKAGAKKQELLYTWRLGRILFGSQATLSSTFQLERTFSLLMLNLEKRRFNLGEIQHSSEARIMIFLKNAAKIKEVLEQNIFKADDNIGLKKAYKALIPWDYCTETNIGEETDESQLDDSLEKETDDEERQSHNWPYQSHIWPSQSDSGRNTTLESQSDSGRKRSSKSQSDSGRKSSKSQSDSGHKPTSKSQSDSGQKPTSKSQSGTGRKTSIEPVYSDKSYSIQEDNSIDIYDASHDITPTGNGHNFDTIIDPVRYPF